MYEIVGEMSFVDASPTYATVKAEQDSSVYSIRRDKLQEKIDTDSGFAARFYHAIAIFLADRLRSAGSFFGCGDLEYAGGRAEEAELSPMILDNISATGDRFNRMHKPMVEGSQRVRLKWPLGIFVVGKVT